MWSKLETSSHDMKKNIDFMLRFTLLHMFWKNENAVVVSEDICTSNAFIVENVFKFKHFSLAKAKKDNALAEDKFKLCTFSMTDRKLVVVDLHEIRFTHDLITIASGNEENVTKALQAILDDDTKHRKPDNQDKK